MKELSFSYNWNKKLDCRCFTSIRLSDRYKVGDQFKILLKSRKELVPKGCAQVIEIKEFYLDQLNAFISHLDTGYSVDQCRKIIERMYPNTNWGQTKLKLLLLKYIS